MIYQLIMMHSSRSPIAIQWFQVLGLAGVEAAISLLWVTYNLYLPQLLSQFEFPEQRKSDWQHVILFGRNISMGESESALKHRSGQLEDIFCLIASQTN